MSVMTRTPGRGGLADLPPPSQIQPLDPQQLQRQAVVDQLGTAPAPAGGPVASSPGQSSTAFNRGGQVKQLPGSGGQTAEQLARTGLSVAGTAAGAFNPVTIGTNFAADKLKVKEEMPTFGGSNAAYLDDKGRRFEGTGGGVASNAVRYAGYGAMAGPIGAGIGAAAGALKGAITKNAPSAYTDFRVEDAADALKAQYRTELGREASDDEVQGHLVGQGWDPNGGDRWVGEKNLNSVMDAIRSSPEAQAFKTRGAVVDQLGSGEATADTSVPSGATRGEMPGAAGGGPASDPSGWNTDGYAAPAYTPPSAGAVPAGWDATKWNDPNHQTPKYGVGRILWNFPPTVDGLKAAMADIEKAYPGTTFNGKDKITVPGVGTVDVLESAGTGGTAWRWGAEDGGRGSASGAAPATTSAAGSSPTEIDAGRAFNDEPMTQDRLAELQAELQRIMAGQPPREQLLAQMGGGNG